ncbi:acyl-CoA dehydrogenase family protein [Rhizobium sp. BK176]|uniref:acyl-CoA dehydrogenase family protein n=1 Tax=Rhizobium sp. BK176 TaxID=2587071 RepID=UPI002168C71F|nr:acyl-CoA dehydrogenase family protein [Rhizobium sp. BK176]MCS4088936.1 alkylation response protein AidB-like acyl-CoA dehydrogenase [Rhizobium sp. BK176]
MIANEKAKTSSDFEQVREDVIGILAGSDFLSADEVRILPPGLLDSLAKAKAFGLCGTKEHGGAELAISEANAVITAAATFDASVASAMVIHNFLSTPCLENAVDLIGKDEILRRTASGEALCAFALTEHGAGSAPRYISATAVKTETGYRINGTKIWIGLGAWAENVVCFAKVPDQGNRVSAFLVDTKSPGFSVQHEHKTMGLRGIVQNTLKFEDVEVPFDRCLSGHGNGYNVAKNSMNKGRLGVAAMSLGVALRATQVVSLYVSQRKIGTQFLVGNPFVQKQIGDMVQRIECMKKILRFAEAAPQDAPLAEYMATVAKVICSEWANEIANEALQLLGGRGYEEDVLVGRMYRDARIMKIFEGPTEVLLAHLDRIFSSKATSVSMEVAFGQIDAADLYAKTLVKVRGDHANGADREVYRGWAIALSFAIGVCRRDEAAKGTVDYLSRRLALILDKVEEQGRGGEHLPQLIEDFLASANGSIRKPNFDQTFMSVKGFV